MLEHLLYKQKVGGWIPLTAHRLLNSKGDNKKKGITWGQYIGRPECPYMRRWVLNLGSFSLRLHHWYKSDDPRYLHDHPWWFITFVLKGSYTDISVNGNDLLIAPTIRYRPALHSHTVQVSPQGCWTLMITGPHSRDWGFYVNGTWKRMRKYFRDHGHHQCE